MPPYRDSVGDGTINERITGMFLVEQSAERDDLIVFGSSELRTTEISTHPANFFEGKRAGFQVNLVGRGSCQSLIHAISIAASGDSLTGKKVALITSPQSYVPEGIAPDMFYANFSEQQYLALLQDDSLSEGLKRLISQRVSTLLDRYRAMPDAAETDPAIEWLAAGYAEPNPLVSARNLALSPYYAFRRFLLDQKDMVAAREPLLSAVDGTPTAQSPIDWAAEEKAAVEEARAMTSNNEFGMLDGYYTTYIGNRLDRQKDKEATLSYYVSEEYHDLRILFEVCIEKGIEPLFIHVPLHGPWSDYTGFSVERRQEYYKNVRDIATDFGIQTLDLTAYEYEEYFLCDVMHLGWKGWLAVDKALVEFYEQ
jgi:D-alanine transfer protein